jgi:mono/diheme cytochrome c family protein
MKTRILWSLLIIGSVVGSSWAQEKRPQKQVLPTPPPNTFTAEQAHHKYNVPVEEKERKNPVRFTELSVDRGRKMFQNHCVLCHGINADGKGDFTGVYGVHPPDFTDPEQLRQRTDGELFYIIGTGSEKMPGQHRKLPERQRWDVVNYLRAVEGQTPAKVIGDKGDTVILKMH